MANIIVQVALVIFPYRTIAKILILLLEKVVARTDNNLDNEILETIKKEIS